MITSRIVRAIYGMGIVTISAASLLWGQNSTPNLVNNPNFTGKVSKVEDKWMAAFAHYKFDPGARTKWHMHSGGQIMLTEEGVSHHQNKGGPVMEMRANESYYVQPGVWHWHGATPTDSAVQFNTTRGDITWGDEVSETDFKAKPKR